MVTVNTHIIWGLEPLQTEREIFGNQQEITTYAL